MEYNLLGACSKGTWPTAQEINGLSVKAMLSHSISSLKYSTNISGDYPQGTAFAFKLNSGVESSVFGSKSFKESNKMQGLKTIDLRDVTKITVLF